jgi:hypothetical protein
MVVVYLKAASKNMREESSETFTIAWLQTETET